MYFTTVKQEWPARFGRHPGPLQSARPLANLDRTAMRKMHTGCFPFCTNSAVVVAGIKTLVGHCLSLRAHRHRGVRW